MTQPSDSLECSGKKVLLLRDRWILEAERLRLCTAPPQLHGTVGTGASSRWVACLDLPGATKTAESVDVPNVGVMSGLVLAGREQVQAPASLKFAWRLTMALGADGLFLHFSFELDPDAPPDVQLEHICLVPTELQTREDPATVRPEHFAELQGGRTPVCRAVYQWLLGSRGKRKRTPEHSSFLVNGWQSFSFSGVLHGAAPQPRTSLPYFSGAFHAGASLPAPVADSDPDALVSDMFGVFWLHGVGGVVAGFLGQEKAFGGLAAHSAAEPLQLLLFSEHCVALRPGGAASTDWAMIQLLPPSRDTAGASKAGLEALRRYFSAVAAHMRVPRCKPQPVGWCSWYCHGTQVSEWLMMGSLQALAAERRRGTLPFSLFQVDDGWQSCWGDWLDPDDERFPEGIEPLPIAVRGAGLVPGLWMAPAALVAGSAVAKAHPEWLLRDRRGRPVSCGFTAPGRWMLALDVTRPEVLAHVKRVVSTAVHEWGFGYLKCDFLHCAAMPGAKRFDTGVSRAGALARLMGAIREAAGEATYVLACGAPLGPCVRHVDAIRVSADTAEHWLPRVLDLPLVRRLFERDETNLPAARNMVRSTLARLPMHRVLWNNDPDCLILRDDVPLPEARARATVAAFSAGSLIFSDSLEKISAERLAILKVLLPPLPRAPDHIDLLSGDIPPLLVVDLQPGGEATEMGPWHLMAQFNWTNGSDPLEASLTLPPGPASEGPARAVHQEWHVFEFWSGAYERCAAGAAAAVGSLEPRCSRLLAVREVRPAVPQLVGSDVHISCGLEIGLWKRAPDAASPSRRRLEVSFSAGRTLEAPRLWLSLPGAVSDRPPCVRTSPDGASEPAPGESALHVSGDVWRLTFPHVEADAKVPFHVEW